MDVTPLIKEGANIIQSYEGGGFRVSGRRFEGALFVTPDKATSWPGGDRQASIKDLSEDDLQPITDDADALDVVLLGTGAKMELPTKEIRQYARAQGVALEVMDTGAACRTYNVLMAEGRRVAAALMPVS